MLQIFSQYTENDMQITEYTKDGTTISHTVRVAIQTESVEPVEPQPSSEEIQTQTLLNTEYLVIMSELTNL